MSEKYELELMIAICPVCKNKIIPGDLCVEDKLTNKLFCSYKCLAKYHSNPNEICFTGKENAENLEMETQDYSWLVS